MVWPDCEVPQRAVTLTLLAPEASVAVQKSASSCMASPGDADFFTLFSSILLIVDAVPWEKLFASSSFGPDCTHCPGRSPRTPLVPGLHDLEVGVAVPARQRLAERR